MKFKKRLLILISAIACVMAVSPVFAKEMTLASQFVYETPYSHWTYKLSYNKNGLLKKYVMSETPEYYATYSYNADGSLKKMTEYGDEGLLVTRNYKLNSKGRLSSTALKVTLNKEVLYKTTYNYKWGNNTCTVTSPDESTEIYKFAQNGKLVQQTFKLVEGGSVKCKFGYDVNGYINAQKVVLDTDSEDDGSYVTKYKNYFTSKRLSGVYYFDEEGFKSIDVAYKTVNVPDAYVKKVKKQQEYMLQYLTVGSEFVIFYEPWM